MFNEDKKDDENKKEKCVNINVFAKCDKDSKKCEKKDDMKIEAACVNINVFAECDKEREKEHEKEHGKC